MCGFAVLMRWWWRPSCRSRFAYRTGGLAAPRSEATPTTFSGVQFWRIQTLPQGVQLVAEQRRVRRPACRLFCHRPRHQRPHRGGNIVRQWWRWLEEMGERDRDRMVARERPTAGQAFVGDHAQRIDIAGRCRRLADGLLWGQVASRTGDRVVLLA